ncbi:cytochrome c oxidase assembly protein [Algimonas porphyrae]|uniref:Cytochrome c oxidase assembly protein CtaG n=1 Tax=Algimonas porphyrae TaxID=1128113 RepID=A0ABQ5V0C1_9PROT|nr:cytochrome c oxidase assembly protein [Algimonas porphyrae]GLQ20989.1 cytochrome c oxidase assembly protein CtaG [Algimonas porphyrae]
MTRNTKTTFLLTALAIGMLGLGFSSKALYDAFCRVTGFGGTPQIAMNADNLSVVLDRTVTVKFDSNISPDLPWEFRPVERAMDVQLGQTGLAYYTARNVSDRPVTGVATFNVTPVKAAPYFVKTECFCFTDQTLQPGEEITMPVLFFVDPEMDNSARHDDVGEVTLSYTFFVAEDQPTQTAAVSDNVLN